MTESERRTDVAALMSARLDQLCSDPAGSFPKDSKVFQYGTPDGHPSVLRSLEGWLRSQVKDPKVAAAISHSDLVASNGERNTLLLLLNHLAPNADGHIVQLLGKWDSDVKTFLKELGFAVTKDEEIGPKTFPDCTKIIVLTRGGFVDRMLKVPSPQGRKVLAVLCREDLSAPPLFARLKEKCMDTEGIVSFGEVSPSLHVSWALLPPGLRSAYCASAALDSGGAPNTAGASLLAPGLHPA